MSERLKILLSGMVAGTPRQAGASWAVLQWLLGLGKLGHEVTFVEPVGFDRIDGPPFSASRTYFESLMKTFDLAETSALLDTQTTRTVGLSYQAIVERARNADLLINISGMLNDPAITQIIPVRLFLDLDPAFNQLWHATQSIDMGFDRHTHFATVGLRIGRPDCLVPTCDLKWIPSLQPIVLDQWPASGEPPLIDAFTTIGNLRGYGSIQHDGAFYGQKLHSLRDLYDLPIKCGRRFALAMEVHESEVRDRDALTKGGWELIDPDVVASTPEDYRAFVGDSKAEIGIAKSGYVVSKCGWFSDRSVCYLASGRPVLAQDTGLTELIPKGEGLVVFRDIDEAVAGVEDIEGDYARHSKAARDIAEAHFDSDKVLPALLNRIG